MKFSILYILLITLLLANTLCAQYPRYYTYNDENGLPSNEVYSIIQDEKGFIWIGCDAGLFKFDGIRYHTFKSKSQNSKSISNLTLAASGSIYCMNFQDQIFSIDHNAQVLLDVVHPFENISNIAADQNGFLYVNHSNGIARLNTKSNVWEQIEGTYDFTRSVVINDVNKAYFLSQNGVGIVSDYSTQLIEFPDKEESLASFYRLVFHQGNAWVFKRDGTKFYTLKNEKFVPNQSGKLFAALSNRKITNLKSLADDNLWIATYNGIIRYHAKSDEVTIFYPELSFADVLLDREGNYWFTTLQTGILRIPNLNYLVWNASSTLSFKKNETLKNEKLTHLTTDENSIYFSSINGSIGKLNTKTNVLETFHTGKNADIECMFYDYTNQHLIFNAQDQSYMLKHSKISLFPFQTNAIKTMNRIDVSYFLGTSTGLLVEKEKQREKINSSWTRQIIWEKNSQQLLVATNNGLHRFQQKQNQWLCTDTLFPDMQIISIDYDEQGKQLFALTFNGQLKQVKDNIAKEILRLPEDMQSSKLKFYQNSLYIATNKGIRIYNLETQKLTFIDHISGLASDNIQDILLLENNIWVATGKGLQKIPLENNIENPLAKVYVKQSSDIRLDHDEILILNPEASIYASNGNFEYAYRINKNEWIKLPGTVDKIEIQNIPTGNVEIELKTIDHLGRDSENTILLKGLVKPPFWRTWWFISVIVLFFASLIFLFFKQRIKLLKKKQEKEIERITLENNLRLTQQSALKAQMNPHFIFNVLNSIKGYIYENDKKNAALYLSRFSGLIRKILEQSSVPYIQLSEEVETLKLYIELEAMLLDTNFEYKIELDEYIETIEIPALLIQPFVENAFKHGLRHKHGAKKLNVNFSADEDFLKITIEDNGIGREAAAKINEVKTYQSFSTGALEQRIGLLNVEHKQSIGLDIIDLKDDSKNAIGTKVVLNIKLK